MRSLDPLGSDAFQPCCKDCRKSDHHSSACPKPKEVVQAGNSDRLEKGTEPQPSSVPGPALCKLPPDNQRDASGGFSGRERMPPDSGYRG